MTCNGLPAEEPSAEELPLEELVAWLDGETDAAGTARVTAHLASCAVCRREAALLRQSGELLARLPGLAPSPGFEARVVAAARECGVATAPRGRLRLLRPRVAAAAAAAMLVGVSLGAWWLSSSNEDGADVLSARDEAAIAEDLAVISNLDALQKTDPTELARLADDLDVIDALGPDEEGG